VLLLAIVLALAFTPFIFPGTKALKVAAKICRLHRAGREFRPAARLHRIVSFAHTMFFGIGAYGIAIASTRLGPGWPAVALGMPARSRCRRCCRS
jgi:branched-chain amino acid transport system permease protein